MAEIVSKGKSSSNDDAATKNQKRGKAGLVRQSDPGTVYGQDPYRRGVEG